MSRTWGTKAGQASASRRIRIINIIHPKCGRRVVQSLNRTYRALACQAPG